MLSNIPWVRGFATLVVILVALIGCPTSALPDRVCPAKNSKCNELRCQIHQLALELSGQILPSCVRGQQAGCDAEVDRVAEALEMSKKCFVTDPYRVTELGSQSHNVKAPGTATGAYYVSPSGSNSNSGTSRESPLQTIAAAVAKTRSSGGARTIVLMQGKHRLMQSVVLTAQDSSLTFQGETGAIVTGAIALDGLSWTQDGAIYSADVPPAILDQLGPLSVLSNDHVPAMRAQHPNKNSFLEQSFLGKNLVKKWTPRPRVEPYTTKIRVPIAPEFNRYSVFSYVSNGSCAGVYDPPTGFFCDPKSDADGSCEYSVAGTIQLNVKGINAVKMNQWTDRSTGYLHALHPLKWGGWSFRIGQSLSDPKCAGLPTGQGILCLAEGGFQESRGDCGRGGGSWYVENIRELLDVPGEFFLDLQGAKIFYYPPANEPFDPSKLEISSSVAKLFEVRGSSSSPVTGLGFYNIQFEHTYPTHMEPHEVTSGGDWAVHRGGALFLEGVQDATVTDCRFQYLGSNGLFVSKFAHNVHILRNDFYALDGTGILLVGDPKYNDARPWDRTEDQDYVSDVLIKNNIISDVGLRELQASGIFGSIAMNIHIENNIVFNGPRAAIVYNDLFGGNLDTIGNIMFNVVRLTHDHGPYNVWDRQKWLLPSGYFQRVNTVRGNFIIGNEYGPKLVDLDDGARNHVVENNVLAYGHMKIKGYNHTATRNVVLAYIPSQRSCVDVIVSDIRQNPNYSWVNNTCFSGNNGKKKVPYYMQGAKYCATNQFRTSDNAFYGFPKLKKIDTCGTIRAWQQNRKQDQGSFFARKTLGVPAIVSTCEETVKDWFPSA